MTFDLNNWYWFVAGDTSQVYSSASHSYVAVADSTYQAWLTDGGITTSIATFIDLIDVLSPEPGAAITEDFSSTSVNPTTGGPWTFAVTASKFFPIGGTLLIRPLADWTIALIGEVSAYSSTSLTVTLRATNATVSQAYTAWSIALLDSPPAKMPPYGIVGLRVTRSSNKFVVSAGAVMDSTNTVLLQSDAEVRKDLTLDFSVGYDGGAIVRTLLAGTISNSGTTVTGSGSSFVDDFSSGAEGNPPASNLDDFSDQGGSSTFPISSTAIRPMISTATSGSRVSAITDADTLTTTGTMVTSGQAYYRGALVQTTGTWIGFVCIIRKDTDGSIDFIACSPTPSGEPDLPSGYTKYRVLAAYLADYPTSAVTEIEQPLYTKQYPFAQNSVSYIVAEDTPQSVLRNARLLSSSTSITASVSSTQAVLQRAALTGDVTASANSNATTLAAGSASNLNSGTLSAARGGTGVSNNVASTITITGSFGTTFTVAGTTSVTLPTSGTLATLAGSEELTNKTLNASVGKGTWTASGTWTLPAHTLGGTISGNGQTISAIGSVIIGTPPTVTGGLVYNGGSDRVLAFGLAGDGPIITTVNTANSAYVPLYFDSSTISLRPSGTAKLKVDGTSTARDTALLVYDVDNATLERVTVGAADSGGAGFKVLRIPN
jgi:hypothetical protein